MALYGGDRLPEATEQRLRDHRSSPGERRSFGVWVVVFVISLFVVPILLKWAGLLPSRM